MKLEKIKTGKWRVDYKGKYIGYFEELEDAIQARLEAEQLDV